MERFVLSGFREKGKVKMYKKKTFSTTAGRIAAMVLAAGLVCVSGCGKTERQADADAAPEGVQIPIILTVDPTTGKRNNQDLADAFNKAYEGRYSLDVEWVLETEEEYRQNLKRMNVTGKLPALIYDVCTVPSFYQRMVEEERLVNLTERVTSDAEWMEMIEPSVLEGSTYEDGQLYLAPISTAAFTCSGMFYNTELFAKAGIDTFPTTWDEFWKDLELLKQSGITPLALHTEGTGWAPMLIATAATAQTPEGEEFLREMLPDSYDTPAGYTLVQTLQKLFAYTTKDALHVDYDVAYSNFFSGKAAMLPNGYWLIGQIPDGWEDKVRFAAFPEGTLVASPETFGWAIVADYDEEVQEGAMEFLKFRTRYNWQEKQTLFAENSAEAGSVLADYLQTFTDAEKIIPNYQTKWNSVLQEETIGKGLPLLAEGEISIEEFLEMMEESILEYQAEQ